MADKTLATKSKDTGVGEEGGEKKHGDECAIYLLKYLFEPTRKQLMGLTNIPLAQVNNLAWMAVYDVATEQACDYMRWKERKRLAEEKGDDFNEPMPDMLSLSGVWSEIYSWLRRSIDGSGVMTASTLAMKQLEMQEVGGENEPPISW